MTPPNIPALLLAAQDEIKTITASLLAAEVTPDATSLAPKIEALMTALQTLPKDEGKAYLTDLEALQTELDALKDKFADHAQHAQLELSRVTTLTRANSAYARHGATTGKREE